jgi:hypothetical protein
VSGAFFNKDYVEKYWLNFIDDLAKRDYFVETLEWKAWVQTLEVITAITRRNLIMAFTT